MSGICCTFAPSNIKTMQLWKQDEVTHKSDWTAGTVIDVEANPFVGTVISAKTVDGEIYFEKEYLFKPAM